MKRVKVKYTPQGYSYIECNRYDCFSWGGAAVCDSCGKNMQDKVYLIYILNSAYCPECFKEWEKSATKFKEDLSNQNKYDTKWFQVHGFETLKGEK